MSKDKKYPYHSDFDSIAGMRLDYSNNLQLKATNAFMRVQTFFDRTEKAVEVKKVRLKGYKGQSFDLEILYPKNHQGKLPCLFFTHGGGFMLDVGVAHYKQCVHYVTELNCIAVLPHYHLAIDHPFPHGLEDCKAALEWVFEHADELDIDSHRLAVGGESAGGCLSAALTQIWRDEKRSPSICFQMLTYPILDQAMQSRTAKEYVDTPFWDSINMRHMWNKYLENSEGVPKYASPMASDSFANLPPAYIEPSEFCPACDEGIAYAEKLTAAGVEAELNVSKGTIHCFDIVSDSEITKEAFRRRTAALKKAFGLTDESIELAEGKKYPFSKDFDALAKFNLDVTSDIRLKMMNFLAGTQYRFTKPEEHTEKKTYKTTGYEGKELVIDVITPKHAESKLPCVYYSHGGGFLMDILPAHMDICSEYAYRANCIVVIPHYHVAINNPFPASIEDCYEGLKWTIDFADKLYIDLEKLVLAGESAGGALTASLSQMVRDRDLIKPIFQMLVYPVTSGKLDSDSMVNMPDAPVWGAKNARISWQKYLAGHENVPKYASPLETEDFNGLPPAYVEPCEFDVLRDEGIAYAKKLEAAGIQVELNVTQGTIHAFDLNKESKITQAAMDSRVNALKRAFNH